MSYLLGKILLHEYRKILEKQHFYKRWPVCFTRLHLQKIKLYIWMRACKALHSFKGIWRLWLQCAVSSILGGPMTLWRVSWTARRRIWGQPEGLGRPGIETWPGCEEPLPHFHDCLREGAGLFWGAPWGSTTSVGRGYWWTDRAQVWTSLKAELGCVFSGWRVEFGALWGPFQILDSAVLGNLHFVLISESLTYGLEMSLSL